MQPRLIRIHLWMLMVLVALAAVVIHCSHLNVLSNKYRAVATFNAVELKHTYKSIIILSEKLEFIGNGGSCLSQRQISNFIDYIKYLELYYNYRVAMKAKYERAANALGSRSSPTRRLRERIFEPTLNCGRPGLRGTCGLFLESGQNVDSVSLMEQLHNHLPGVTIETTTRR